MVSIPPSDAYGDRSDEAVQLVPMDVFPETPRPEQLLHLVAPDGNEFAATVIEVLPDGVLLDFNHPLAGRTLNFELELVEVV
jgi:FKBP-type peptidyl-prolyl cis-trans isomerase 2